MEKVLIFKYPFEFLDKVKQLKEVLKNSSIEFICYESSDYYPHEFVIRKSGKRWNDIYKIINSVRPAKYEFKKTCIESVNGELKETVYVNKTTVCSTDKLI